ncbi:MAG TPA: S8 family serine peptidase [Bryobacteraceae bacterium]
MDPCFADVVNSPYDSVFGHGTEVAGVVAGKGISANSLFHGVANGLGRLYTAKVFYHIVARCVVDGVKVKSSDSDMAAIDWAATKTPVFIVNLSLGEPARLDDDFAKYVDRYADTYGLLFSIAAGNDGCGPNYPVVNPVCVPTPRSIESPGIAYNGITVANWDHQRDSSGRTKGIWPTSSRGPTAGGRNKPDVAAPGLVITADLSPVLFGFHIGTSFSAPHVSGALALLRQFGITSPVVARALLINSADRTPGAGWQSDRGCVNAQNCTSITSNIYSVIINPPDGAPGCPPTGNCEVIRGAGPFTGAIQLTTGPGCGWTVQTSALFAPGVLTVAPTSGASSATLTWTLSSYPLSQSSGPRMPDFEVTLDGLNVTPDEVGFIQFPQ